MGRLGLLVFASPLQHRTPVIAAGLAEAASAQGHLTTVFFLGDGVLVPRRAVAAAEPTGPSARLAALGAKIELVNCSTCARLRGVGDADLVANARNGTLEDLVDLLRGSDRFVTLGQEE